MSKFHYLVIEFTNLTDFLSKFQNGFSNIQTINETWKEKCSKEKLEITEVMGYASGTTKRFIEWIGSKTNPTCLGSVNISITETTKILNLDSPFLFPGAVKLFIEEESPLQGIVLKDLNWKEIKSNSTLDIRHFDLADTWKLPESVKFNWVLDEFSLKRKQSNCEWSNVITLNSKFCGDPGIEFAETLVAINPNDNTTPTTGNTPPLENCKPDCIKENPPSNEEIWALSVEGNWHYSPDKIKSKNICKGDFKESFYKQFANTESYVAETQVPATEKSATDCNK